MDHQRGRRAGKGDRKQARSTGVSGFRVATVSQEAVNNHVECCGGQER